MKVTKGLGQSCRRARMIVRRREGLEVLRQGRLVEIAKLRSARRRRAA